VATAGAGCSVVIVAAVGVVALPMFDEVGRWARDV
jgi:hypothetical protein